MAAAVTRVIAAVFEHGHGSTPGRMAQLLADARFWLFGAFAGDTPVGGLSAHVLPVTAQDGHELFIYDIAVQVQHQRRGIGRRLMQAALAEAAEAGLLAAFVPADNDDAHALDFYRAIGGQAQPVTFFNFDCT